MRAKTLASNIQRVPVRSITIQSNNVSQGARHPVFLHPSRVHCNFTRFRGDASKASRHTPAIDHDALRRRNPYRIHQVSIYDTASHALCQIISPIRGYVLNSPTRCSGPRINATLKGVRCGLPPKSYRFDHGAALVSPLRKHLQNLESARVRYERSEPSE